MLTLHWFWNGSAQASKGALPKETLNLHLGISPEFKGAATLFWPFYFQKPGWAGATFHYLSDRADSGDIVHQVLPQLDITDGIHDVGAKTVLESIQGAQHILHILERTENFRPLTDGIWENIQQ